MSSLINIGQRLLNVAFKEGKIYNIDKLGARVGYPKGKEVIVPIKVN